MPLFTRCNIGLGCPQNVFVKFQHKIPKIYYNHLKISFLGPVSKSITILNVNKLHIPTLPLDEGVTHIPVAVGLSRM